MATMTSRHAITLRLHGLLVALCLAVAAQAQAQMGDIVIEQTIAPRTPIFVAPGGSTELAVTVRNVGTAPVALTTLRGLGPFSLPNSPPPDWIFGPPTSPRCSAMRLGRFNASAAWDFDIHNLLPDEQVTCTYPLDRGVSIMADMRLHFQVITPADDPGPGGNSATWVIGSLTELELSVSEACDLPATDTSRTVRVSLRNRGPTPIDPTPFGYCLDNFFPAFRIDGEIAGGCGPMMDAPGVCFFGGIGWTMPALANGEETACLLHLSDPHITLGRVDPFPIQIVQPYRSGPFSVLDTKSDRLFSSLSLNTPSTCSRAVPPAHIPANAQGWLLLAIAAVLILAARVRRS